MGQPLHKSLKGIKDYPYTLSYVVRKSLQINSFSELPKDKQPPERIYFFEDQLEEWFDNINEGHATGFSLDKSEIE